MTTSIVPVAAGAPGTGVNGTRGTPPPPPLPLPDLKRARREEIVGLCYRQACDAVRIGQCLAEVRARMKRAGFLAWVAELPFSRRTARRLMDVAAVFGGHAAGQFARFDLSALYVLAHVDTPPAVRAAAVALADAGQRVTHAAALGLIAERAERPDVREYDRRVRAIDDAEAAFQRKRDEAFKAFTDERRVEGDLRPAEAVRRWNLLVGLMRDGATRVLFEPDADADGPLPVVLTVHYGDGDRDPVVRRGETPADALDAAAGGGAELTKECTHCRVQGRPAVKPLSDFNRDQNEKFGRARWCRQCDKERKAVAREQRRAAKGQAPGCRAA